MSTEKLTPYTNAETQLPRWEHATHYFTCKHAGQEYTVLVGSENGWMNIRVYRPAQQKSAEAYVLVTRFNASSGNWGVELGGIGQDLDILFDFATLQPLHQYIMHVVQTFLQNK